MKKGPLLLLSFITILAAVSLIAANRSARQTTVGQADVSFCDDKCAGSNRCDLNNAAPNGDPNYNDSCCINLQKTGDPGACAWPQRGYCTVDQCNAIPEGVNRQRCGGPRWEWCQLCQQNNCPGYSNTPTNVPSPTANPTAIVHPTSVPTVIPTAIPTVAPTAAVFPTQPAPILQPTAIIQYFPTDEPSPSPYQPFSFQLPSLPTFPAITLPSINQSQVNQLVAKPVNFFKLAFFTVRELDRKLENTINGDLKQIIH